MTRWPNLFIVGAPKAGTTSLHRYLDQHPEIFMSPEKEPSFFGAELDEVERDQPPAREAREKAYLSLFDEATDERYLGEATPFYLWHPDVPERIANARPDARIVISLRDPVDRAYSHYLMEHREGREDESFIDAIQADLDAEITNHLADRMYIAPGRYCEQVERYLDVFGEDQVFVMTLGDLKQDARGLLEEIVAFLGLDTGPVAEIDLERHYSYREPRSELARKIRNDERVKKLARMVFPLKLREFLGDQVLLGDSSKPPMEPEARELLAGIYEPEIDCLESLLGEELPELRASWDGSGDE